MTKASRNWTRARSDAASAAEALGDAVSIVGSDLASRASEGLDEARESLAHAIEPTPSKTRRLPWLLALIGLTVLSIWGWRQALRRPDPTDPGTPLSTVAPSEGELFGKPVGNSPDRTEA
jgi:hypothetical protein